MKDEIWLKNVLSDVENQMRENNLEGFKTVVKVLAKDSLRIPEDSESAWEQGHNSQELKNRFRLLHRYLDYLKRFIEGVA